MTAEVLQVMEHKLNLTERRIVDAFIKTNAGTDKTVAAETNYSYNTVTSYMRSIKAKFQVDNRSQLFARIKFGV